MTSSRHERIRAAQRTRDRLPWAFAATFGGIIGGFAVVAVVLWLILK